MPIDWVESGRKKKKEVLYSNQVTHAIGAYPDFQTMKRLGVLPLPPLDRMSLLRYPSPSVFPIRYTACKCPIKTSIRGVPRIFHKATVFQTPGRTENHFAPSHAVRT